jgi:multidrug resistance efflux pump
MTSSEAANAAIQDRQPVDAPAPPLRLLVLALAALALGIGASRWLESGGDHPVSAYVQVRTTFVTADRVCRVLQHVQAPGERITIGDTLISFADTELEERIATARLEVAALQKELSQREARAKLELAQSEQAADDRICEVQLQAADYRQSRQESEMRRSLLADLLASRQSAMWDNGDQLVKSMLLGLSMPKIELMQTNLQLESYATQTDLLDENIKICEARLESLRSMRCGLCEQIRESCGVSLTTHHLQQAEQNLAQLEERQTQLTVASPAVGQVGVYRSRPGDVLQPGDPIVELLDDSQRYLVAEVPSTRITEFKIGRTTTLTFPGAELRQGRVVRVAPQAGPRNSNDPLADPLVQVEIEPAGRLWPTVPIGTRIEAIADR